jgi:hypothetical protein
METKTKMSDELKQETSPAEAAKSVENFYALVRRTNKENPKDADVLALRAQLREHSHVWRDVADLAKYAENQILSANALRRECVRLRLEEMRDELGWSDSSELEKILIEQVCLNWLRLNLLEMLHNSKTTESHTTEAGLYWDKRLTQAQRRYLRAIESLAKTRKLLAQAERADEQSKAARRKASLQTAHALGNIN